MRSTAAIKKYQRKNTYFKITKNHRDDLLPITFHTGIPSAFSAKVMYDFCAVSVRRSTEKSTWFQSPRALLEPAILTITPKKRWRRLQLTSRKFSSKCSQNWRSLKPFRKVICNFCNTVRYFAKYSQRLTLQSFFCGTGSNLIYYCSSHRQCLFSVLRYFIDRQYRLNSGTLLIHQSTSCMYPSQLVILWASLLN